MPNDASDLSPDDERLREILLRHERNLVKNQIRSLEILAAGVAHEFNNLLAGITGYCQLALEREEDAALTKKALTASLRAARRGGEIVSSLRHFSRSEDPEWEVGDIAALTRDLVTLWKPDCQHLGILVEEDYAETPAVRFDPTLFSIALLNILQNAKAAVSEPGVKARIIRVRTRLEDGDAVVRVLDSGPGIPPSALANAGDPFFTLRGPLAHGRDPDAKGLGLAVAQGILTSLDGHLAIESRPEEGVEVRLALPPSAPVAGERGKILIADDEPAICRIFSTILNRGGYEVKTVEDGQAAMEIFLTERFDLILLDQMMPRMSGLEVLTRLREIRAKHEVPPVVMITAAYSPDLARQSVELGAAACLAKPVNREKLLFVAGAYTGTPLRRIAPPPEAEPPESFLDRILIIEHDALTREILELMLKRFNFRITAVDSGGAAIQATESEYFDAILIDILLHDRPGVQVLRQLRVNNPYTPILVTSSRINRFTLREALAAGATRALRKPIDIEQIIGEIRDIVRVFRHPNAGA